MKNIISGAKARSIEVSDKIRFLKLKKGQTISELYTKIIEIEEDLDTLNES
jgi:hypothetical protein